MIDATKARSRPKPALTTLDELADAAPIPAREDMPAEVRAILKPHSGFVRSNSGPEMKFPTEKVPGTADMWRVLGSPRDEEMKTVLPGQKLTELEPEAVAADTGDEGSSTEAYRPPWATHEFLPRLVPLLTRRSALNLILAALLSRTLRPAVGATADAYGDVIAAIPGRVSWWRFGESTPGADIAVDEEGVQNGAYVGGYTIARPPLPENTDDLDVNLNGTSEYVEVTDNTAYHLANGTLLCWVRPSVLAGSNRTIVSKDAGGLSAGDFLLWYVASLGRVHFQIEGGGTTNRIGSSAGILSPNTTYCMLATWGAAGMKLYLASGGALQLVGTHAYTGGLTTNTRNWRFGAGQIIGTSRAFFAGRWGDVVLWNRQLNEAEIKAATQASLAGTGGYEIAVMGLTPVIYLKLDETSGATVTDSSGKGRNGTITGTPTGYNVTALAPNIATGNGGLNLGPASIRIAHATADTTLAVPSNWSTVQSTNGFRFIGDCTVVCWFKPNALPGAGARGVIFAKAHTAAPGTAASFAETTPILANRGGTVNGGSWEAYIDSAGAVHVEVRSFRGRLCRIRTPNGAVSAGTGYHLAVQLSYDGVAAWLNGAKFEDGYANALHVFGLCANIRGAVFRNNYPWTIGAAPWGGQSNIQVDEFAVYLRAPSATITQANINSLSNNVGTPAPLAHHIWGQREVNRSSFASLQAAVDNVSGLGGGTVLVNGGATAGAAATYNESVILKNNVRIKKNPANAGHAQINGRCTCRQPTVATLTDNASDFLTGDTTLNITNTRAAGDVVQVMATQGNPSPRRVARRYIPNSANDNDANVPDSEFFEIKSRNPTTGELTFVGCGSMFDFPSANRAFVKAFTPVRDVALEGDLRFTASGADAVIDLSYVNRARIISVRGTTSETAISQYGGFAVRTLQGARSCQFRNVTIAQRDMQIGVGSNDGLSFYNGSIDCVGINCTTTEGRHGFDVASNGNVGTTSRCDCINHTWVNNVSRDAGGALSAFGVHGGTVDTIYWHCFSNWGGTAATGWKHDSRWHVCGETANAGGGIHLEDGGGDSTYRDIHVIRPNVWFGVFEGATDVQRCHFQNITRTANPTDTGVHENIYGTGANINTYSGTVHGLPAAGVWQQV